MAFNINDFRASMISEVQRNNHFDVLITGMPGVLGGAAYTELLSMRAYSSQLPGENLATVERKTNGSPRKIVYSTTELDLPMTFIATAEMTERDVFAEWQERIYNKMFENPYYYDDYVGRVLIRTYDHMGEVNTAYELLEAYPLSVGPMELSWDAQNQFATFTVDWAYRKWEKVDIGRAGAIFGETEEQLNQRIFGDLILN